PATFEARQPTWSPDSQSLAVQGYDDNAWHIYTIRADGTGLRALTSGAFDDREPDWSRDGTRIAFSSDRSGGIYPPWMVAVQTRAVAQVSKSFGVMPCWAASSREIIFEGKAPADQKGIGWWVVAPPGRERVAGGPGSEVNVPMCGNGRARRVTGSMPGVGTADIF